jgi:phage-related protein
MPPSDLRFRVEFYRDETGNKPVAELLRSISRSNPVLAAAMKAELSQLEDRRYHGFPHTKSIPGWAGLFELRVRGHDDARFLFFFAAKREIVVVHAFVKKSQRIPRSELDVAMDRKRRHEVRR